MNGAAREDNGRQSLVGAAVNGEIDFAAENFAVFADCSAMARSRRMALGGGGHVFHAVVNHFDGLPGFPGEERGVRGNHRGIFFLAAKRAAGFHLHDADAILGQAEKLHEGFVDVIRTLQRAPDGEAMLGVEGGDHAVVFDVELLLRAGGVFAFDDEVRVLPDGIDVAFFDQIGFEKIVRAPDYLGDGFAFFDGEERGKRIVFYGNGSDSFGEKMAVGMSEEEKRLFGMIDEAIGEAGLIVVEESDAIFAGNVFWGDDDELAPVDFGTERKVFDYAARDLAANSGAEEHARQDEVVDVAGLASDFGKAFPARNGRTDDGGRIHASGDGGWFIFMGPDLWLALVYDRRAASWPGKKCE